MKVFPLCVSLYVVSWVFVKSGNMNQNLISNQFHKLSFQIGDAEDVQFSLENLLQLRSAQKPSLSSWNHFRNNEHYLVVQSAIDEAIKAIL